MSGRITLVLDPGAAMIAYCVLDGTTLLRWGHIRRHAFTKRQARGEIAKRIRKLATDFPVHQIVVELPGGKAKREFDQEVLEGAQMAAEINRIPVYTPDFEPYLMMAGLAGQQRDDAFPQRRKWCQAVFHVHVPDHHICDTLILGYTFLQRQRLGSAVVPPHCEISYMEAAKRRLCS